MLLSREAITTPLVACLCILGISLSQFPRLQKLLISKQTASIETLEKDQQKENLRLNLLKQMPSFSYDNVIADWAYIDFLQYFGDNEARDKIGYSLSPEYFEVILKRDPRFLAAYLGLSVSTSLYAGMPERSITLMEKGLKSLSPQIPQKSYYVWRYKGTDELLFLGDSQAAKESFSKAASWASNFTDDESKNAAFISGKTAEFLQNNPDSKFARIATWTMVLQNNVDEKTRNRAIQEIEKLGGKVTINDDGVPAVTLPAKD
ncbi:hypothetical protein H6G54_12510 [Anabaena cylindrica FACHB-243]|uniref:Uncharacterized protein n=1 Tax=Anabaena cylindrica (strain ATCC 27899 / PCC 7122) TaxID=272123 RepID=K9ZEC6_ANACC|nr:MULTISPECIES: hypothetical protein [Anabaena]AFZ57568.1 hypothetical protein Anacy_2089 [Anabaena cylindrica PCC 7122]AZL96662.1 hypothetical protein [Anabaena sp. CCAP 1446/1C]MBD2418505.1 hypothetical protein [Anabaena cylindrica FACHB-243]MBY5284991.1 hypothetical protein [Anabaena sp. CCAP 1446/1C]MBY5307271.1 hypothetical protein [Anabaena sp. CCAP 1446/1C]